MGEAVGIAARLASRRIGVATVLFGARGGKYPDGNSLLVQGREEALLVDPSLGLFARRESLRVDRVVLSHCHEDHIAGLSLFPRAVCHVHEDDRLGLLSIDHLMQIYGYPEPIASRWREVVLEKFRYEPRPEARGFEGEAVFELGGGVRVHAIPAPGHTRGHCVLRIEPDDSLYLGDIDLSSFGPYYGDAWSSLDDFERTLARVRELEARTWITFHHVGVIEDRDTFLARLDRFAAVIRQREERLLAFLAEPRTLAEVVLHRFVYRPGDAVAFADAVEHRSMLQHLERLRSQGRLEAVEEGRFRTIAG